MIIKNILLKKEMDTYEEASLGQAQIQIVKFMEFELW